MDSETTYTKGYYIGYLLGSSGSPALMLYHDGKGFKSNEYYKPEEYIEAPWEDMVIDRCVLSFDKGEK